MTDNFRRSIIASVSVIAGSFLLFGAAFFWLGDDLAVQAEDVFTSHSFIQNRARALDILARLKQHSLAVKGYENQINLLIPTQDGLLDLSKWVNTVSRVQGVTSQFSFQGSVTLSTPDAPGSAGFTLDTTGSLENILKFLRELEAKSPRFLVSLSGFDVTRSPAGGRVQAQGQAYFR